MDSAVYQRDNPDSSATDSKVSFHESVIRQIEEEYWAAWWFHKPRVQEWQSRLKLYNNQKRAKGRIGSPDIFSFHQILLSALYEDRLKAEFTGRTEEDDEAAENLTILSENDYEEARMAELDYEWDFDSSLYGRGIMLINDWDYESENPAAEVIDPLVLLRDPNAQSLNGNVMGQNAARFFGREIRRTEKELYESGDYVNLGLLKKDAQGFRTFSPLWDAERARKEAQGYNTPYQSYSLTTNLDWTILQWFTIVDGQRYMIELGNDRQLIIRMVKLGKKWPGVDRTIYPIAHDWDGVSVFDIMEDKQRFRAQLLNVYGDLAKAKLYEMWLFDEDKVRKNADLDFQFQKRIPVIGNPNDAIVALRHPDAGGDVNFVLDFLDKASQKAVGVNEVALGQLAQRGKVGLARINAAKMDARMSLVQKIWGWSESERWRRWYDSYEENFKGGTASKILKVEGSAGREYRKIRPKDVIASHPSGPIIKITSKSATEAKKAQNYAMMKDFFITAVKTDPQIDKHFGLRKLGEMVMKKSEVKYIIPYTFDENEALDENEKLNKGEVVRVKPEDNHEIHLRIHAQTKDTPEAEAHIKMHNQALLIKRTNPHLFPAMNQGGQNPQEAALAKHGTAEIPTGEMPKVNEGEGRQLTSVPA